MAARGAAGGEESRWKMAVSVDVQDAEIAQLLEEWSEGDPDALTRIVDLIYGDLHDISSGTVARERPQHTLQATALINEIYVRLIQVKSIQWKDRRHFLGFVSQVMRRVLVDHARARHATKRGSESIPPRLAVEGIVEIPAEDDIDITELDEALGALIEFDPRQGKIFELGYFVGLTVRGIAELLDISPATVKREYRMARLWFRRALRAT